MNALTQGETPGPTTYAQTYWIVCQPGYQWTPYAGWDNATAPIQISCGPSDKNGFLLFPPALVCTVYFLKCKILVYKGQGHHSVTLTEHSIVRSYTNWSLQFNGCALHIFIYCNYSVDRYHGVRKAGSWGPGHRQRFLKKFYNGRAPTKFWQEK